MHEHQVGRFESLPRQSRPATCAGLWYRRKAALSTPPTLTLATTLTLALTLL